MSEELAGQIQSTFKNVLVEVPEATRLIVKVGKEQVHTLLDFLKDKGYDHLALVSCVDWIEEKEFELVYILTPYLRRNDGYTDRGKSHVILKTRIPRGNPEFPTVIAIFKNAEPYERELHELFGIKFEGHPRLTPLLLEREYEIPPFRKDFDTRKYVEETFGVVSKKEAEKEGK